MNGPTKLISVIMASTLFTGLTYNASNHYRSKLIEDNKTEPVRQVYSIKDPNHAILIGEFRGNFITRFGENGICFGNIYNKIDTPGSTCISDSYIIKDKQ